MPLSLSNRDQNSGHLFYNRRLRAATTRFSVRMKHDDRKQTAALALSMVLVAIAAGWMMLLNVLKPTGIVGDSTAECSGEICRRQAGGHQVDATDPCCAERRQG